MSCEWDRGPWRERTAERPRREGPGEDGRTDRRAAPAKPEGATCSRPCLLNVPGLRVTDPRIGEIAIPNVVPRLTGTSGGVRWLGPTLGEHTEAVSRKWLGLSPEQVADLGARGVV